MRRAQNLELMPMLVAMLPLLLFVVMVLI